jgi:hypothetical protein
VERYEKALIESLGSELQPLEIPGVALFTLVVGVLLTTFIGNKQHSAAKFLAGNKVCYEGGLKG